MPKAKTIFLAYAFKHAEVRAAVEAAADGLALVQCADSRLTGKHLLDKIEEMMTEADVNLFDLTGYNVNVAVEYGLARGLGLSPYILYNENPEYRPSTGVPDIFSDARGLDGIRYNHFDQLTSRLREYLPDVITRAAVRPTSVSPRLQMELQARADPAGRAFFVGTIYNASNHAAERVQYALAGYVDTSHTPPTLYRAGTLVPGQKRDVIMRYDDLAMQTQAIGMEHVLVEFTDDSGRRYEQRGRLISHRDVVGRFSYVFDGLTRARPIERFSLPPYGLEEP